MLGFIHTLEPGLPCKGKHINVLTKWTKEWKGILWRFKTSLLRHRKSFLGFKNRWMGWKMQLVVSLVFGYLQIPNQSAQDTLDTELDFHALLNVSQLDQGIWWSFSPCPLMGYRAASSSFLHLYIKLSWHFLCHWFSFCIRSSLDLPWFSHHFCTWN